MTRGAADAARRPIGREVRPYTGEGRRARVRARVRRGAVSYVMLLPFAGLFVAFLLWPLANSLYLSLTDFDGINAPRFTGLGNFRRMLHDDRFGHALSNTALYVVATVVLTTVLSLGIALAFRGSAWRDRVMRTIFFLPSVTSTIAIMLIWKWIFDPNDFGLANTVIGWFGHGPVQWLATPGLSVPILVLMAVWGGMGYGMVIFVAGLNAIPEEYYEAARIDGASTWQQFRRITLPLLRPVTTYVVVTSLIGAFQVFEAVYIVYRTQANTIGGVLDSALMIVPYLYDMGFTHFQLGYASAIAWVLFAVIFGISLVNLRAGRALEEIR